ncbi:MAG TPA: hypothetical protein PLX23_00555 [Candidatus Hydrogenedens sp.]|nr:hypothetical protein [Candidatus Hydrogenedens sp.]
MRQTKNKWNKIYLQLLFLFLLFSFVFSCNQKDAEKKQPSEKTNKPVETIEPKTSPETPAIERNNANPLVTGKIIIIDSTGKPLENMAGIATEKPNAFDEPIARGNLSGPDGISIIQVPKNKAVYIRAWDPVLHYFPNNYFEIAPTNADYLEDMQVVMLEASSVELRLIDKDSQPISNENVGLMMFHPKLGPWWPCNAHTDEAGNILFSPLPAGMYNLRIKTENGMILEIKEVKILPGSSLNLGIIKPT